MSPKLPEPGWLIADKYRIEAILSRGGMGAIFAARHEMTGGRIAIKWMLPKLLAERSARERFIREAQLGARIEHPNVVPVFDIGEDRDSLFLVMALLEGESLGARLTRGPLGVSDAVRVLSGALRGVAAAHAMGVVHRDLKPDNIFLAKMPDGRPPEPKVLDFGISKIHESNGGIDLALTGAGALLGTPHYMAEEQVRSAEDVDARADTYALGVILYECISGRRPFEGESFGDLVLQIATETPPSIDHLVPNLDPGLAAVITRAMSRSRAQRFPDAAAFADALAPFLLLYGDVTMPTPSGVHPFAAHSLTPLPLRTPESDALQRSYASHAVRGNQTALMPTPTGASIRPDRTPFTATSASEGTASPLPRLGVIAVAMLAMAVLVLGGLAMFLSLKSEGAPEAEAPTDRATRLSAAAQPSQQQPAATDAPAPTTPSTAVEMPFGLAAPEVTEQPLVDETSRPAAAKVQPTSRGERAQRPRPRANRPRGDDEGLDPWADDIGRAWELGDEPDAPRRARD